MTKIQETPNVVDYIESVLDAMFMFEDNDVFDFHYNDLVNYEKLRNNAVKEATKEVFKILGSTGLDAEERITTLITTIAYLQTQINVSACKEIIRKRHERNQKSTGNKRNPKGPRV
jgi:hypothetical protein